MSGCCHARALGVSSCCCCARHMVATEECCVVSKHASKHACQRYQAATRIAHSCVLCPLRQAEARAACGAALCQHNVATQTHPALQATRSCTLPQAAPRYVVQARGGMQGGAAVAGQLVAGRVPLAARASAKGSARAGSRRACVVRAAKGKREEEELPSNVSYGSDWYEATRRLSKRRSTREALSACAAALSACAAGSRTLTRDVPMSRQLSTARQTSGCATGLREARAACAHAARFDACPRRPTTARSARTCTQTTGTATCTRVRRGLCGANEQGLAHHVWS
jgi:hypothetical protein